MLSAGDSLKITVFGRGAHGSMPHNAVGPVVLAAAIVLRLQTIVSRETQPGQFAVVTVGASNAGTTANVFAANAMFNYSLFYGVGFTHCNWGRQWRAGTAVGIGFAVTAFAAGGMIPWDDACS